MESGFHAQPNELLIDLTRQQKDLNTTSENEKTAADIFKYFGQPVYEDEMDSEAVHMPRDQVHKKPGLFILVV